VPGTSRCPRGAAKQDITISSEPGRVLTETQIGKIQGHLRESEGNPQEHLPMETNENTQIEAISEGLVDEDHQAKKHKVLIRDIQQ
jgi:hypothetical protein